MKGLHRVGISIGTNIGDRKLNIINALRKLKIIFSSKDYLISSVYETLPVDCKLGDPMFYNLVIDFETNLLPFKLLEYTQNIELSLGRKKKREINSPRIIDLDILYYDQISLNTDSLIIPHPRMYERSFIMIPLLEIRQDFESKNSTKNSSEVKKVFTLNGLI